MSIIDEIYNPKKTPLQYEKYKEYSMDIKEKGRWRFRFPNNYGASVIKFYGSYGYQEDLFELAVLYNDELTYNTPIADDVIGWLTNNEVLDYLEKIKNLEEDKINE